MPHIKVEENVPGIRSLVMFSPETGQHLYTLAQELLRGSSTLSAAERELIAAYTSKRNDCGFCMNSHAAAARCLYGPAKQTVDEALADLDHAMIGSKLKALLKLAGKVQTSGLDVKVEDIESARADGATDAEIHDAVLIAATFSMFNRYVDGLASFAPEDPAEYEAMGSRMAEKGYVLPRT